MCIKSALAELVDDITENEYDEDLMVQIAQDNGVAPRLLLKRFEEEYGCAPADYSTGVSV